MSCCMKTRRAAHRRSRFHIFSLFLQLFFAMLLLTSCGKKSPDVPQIGALLPLTGAAATTGQQLQNAIRLAVDDHAAKTGTRAIIVIEDSRNDSATGITGFRKLATLDKVDCVIVSLSAVSQAVAPLANSEKIASFALASAPISHTPNDYMLRWFIDGLGEAQIMARYLASKGFKRIAIAHINDEYGRILSNEFKSQLSQTGIKPVAVESFERNLEDFRGTAFRLKETNPDVVYFIGYGRPLGIALKQSLESGLKVPYTTTFGFEIAGTRELAADSAEGLVYTAISFGEGANVSDATKSFVTRFRDTYKTEPSSDAALAYDLTLRLLEEGPGRKEPRNWVGRNFPSQFGEMRVSDALEVLAPVILKQNKNGRVSAIAP